MNEELNTKLRHLRLSGFVEALPIRNQQAVHNNLAHVEFLELLVEDELTRRRDRLHARRLKQAQILQVKSLESFDWTFNPKIPKHLVLDLATASFVSEHGGVLLIGPPGTGKSHISVSMACRAIEAGYTVLYRSAFDLAQDFAEADATGTRKDLVQRLCRVDLLVIEDLGMRHLPSTAAQDLLEVFTRRYEQGAIILTTNRRSRTGARCSATPLPPARSLTASYTTPRWSSWSVAPTGCTSVSSDTRPKTCSQSPSPRDLWVMVLPRRASCTLTAPRSSGGRSNSPPRTANDAQTGPTP